MKNNDIIMKSMADAGRKVWDVIGANDKNNDGRLKFARTNMIC